MLKFFLFWLSISSFHAFAQKDEIHNSLIKAQELYDQEKYSEAVSIYEEIVASHFENGKVFFNLGNTYYRLGKKGLALAAYFKARSLLPRDPDVRANIQLIHQQMEDKLDIEKKPSVFRLMFQNTLMQFTVKEISYCVVWLFALAFIGFFLAMWIRLGNAFLIGGWLFFSVAILLSFLLFFSYLGKEEWTAITSPQAQARSAPQDKAPVLFELHEGAPILLRQEESFWYQIELSDEKIGWIAKQDTKAF